LRDGSLVDYLEVEGVDLVDFVAVKFNFWWIKLDINIPMSLFIGVFKG
jgi:hypothetical protein